MKKILSVVMLLCVCTTMNAQKFNVRWGEKAKLLKNDFDNAIALPNGNSIMLKTEGRITVFNRKLKYVLLLVDKNLETIKESEVEFDSKYISDCRLVNFKNAIFLLYNDYSKENKTTTAYAAEVNTKEAKTGKLTTLGAFESDNLSDQASVNIQLSTDSSKVMVFAEGPERKKEDKKYFIGVFDNNLNKIWKREVTLPIQEKFVYIADEDFTDDGNVYVAIKHFDKEVTKQSVRENGKRVPSYTFKLIKYSEKEEKEIKLNLNDNFVQGTRILYNPSGLVTIAGMYKKKYNGKLNGVFYAILDPKTNLIKTSKMVDFDADIIKLIDKDGYASDKEKDPGLDSDFKINYIINRNNGSIDLLAEYYQEIEFTRTSSNGATTIDTRYQYGDIVNTNIDKDGKVTFTRVPKNQKMTNYKAFLGYYAFSYKDKLVLIYNDDKDNVDRDLSKKPDDVMRFNKSALVAATISSKGELSREAISDNDDEDYVPTPRYFNKMGEGKFMMTANLIKMFRFKTRYGYLDVK
jgi:hypothetical protein